MASKEFNATYTGISDLLLHADNIPFGDMKTKYLKDPRNKKSLVPGDDRYPGWGWIGCCYTDGKILTIDSDVIMSNLRAGGARCPAPKGRGSLKAATQSGITTGEIHWPLMIKGKTIPWEPIAALMKEPDFEVHQAFAQSMGFEIFVKRAPLGKGSKVVRCRPKFADWSIKGTLIVPDDSLTQDVMDMILREAGYHCGIGDWRPGAPKSPGQFGRFTATLTPKK